MSVNTPATLQGSRVWKVGTKLTAFTVALAGAIFLALTLFAVKAMSDALEKRTVALVSTEVQGVGNMIDTFNRSQLVTVEKFSRAFSRLLPGTFSIDTGRTVDTGGTKVHVQRHDGADLNLDFSTVDKFTDMTGGNATVFIKTSDDFVRVTTSVKKADGSRAVGTNLGKTHPAYNTLMQGQTYRGMAVLFGKPHVTEYVPIKDAQNAVIGVLYVGIDISADITALQERIRSRKVGDSGYFFVLNSKEGDNLGKFIVHPEKQGVKSLDLRDSDGREYVKEMLDAKEGIRRLVPMRAEGQLDREQLIVFQSNKDWNWLIGGVAYVDEVTREVTTTRNVLLIAGVLALLGFAACLFVIVRRVVSEPLSEVKHAAEKLSQGDLRVRIDIRRQDEIGQLIAAMNGISEGLSSVITTIRQGTDQVGLASTEIAAGNRDLSSRTEQQASSLEETVTSMEELMTTVKQNADSARQANHLASSASTIAVKGGEVVSQVVSTMGDINDSSRKIVDIISVIDGIAFQTNILALNAAVEAARAGEQGRGFAVVAAEVRNLAQRSAGAAKEIKELISNSVQKVEMGSQLVNEAGQTMSEVVESVKRVTDIMSEILAASDDQSRGIEEINQAISLIDQSTQQNAALVEQASAAAQSMQDMAGKLSDAVSVFKVDGTQAIMAEAGTARSSSTPQSAITPAKKAATAPRRPAPVASPQPERKLAITKSGGDWEEF